MILYFQCIEGQIGCWFGCLLLVYVSLRVDSLWTRINMVLRKQHGDHKLKGLFSQVVMFQFNLMQ